mgnify:CR=1 FL=1
MSQHSQISEQISELLKQYPDNQVLPLDKWSPEACGEMDLEIKANGEWWHQGSLIKRDALVKLFARVLWQEEGRYFLKTPVEKIEITVERLPFQIVDVEVRQIDGQQVLVFSDSYGDHIAADQDHPVTVTTDLQSGEPEPALTVRFGMKGLISRSLFYRLIELAEQEALPDGREQLVLSSAGERFVLGEF